MNTEIKRRSYENDKTHISVPVINTLPSKPQIKLFVGKYTDASERSKMVYLNIESEIDVIKYGTTGPFSNIDSKPKTNKKMYIMQFTSP